MRYRKRMYQPLTSSEGIRRCFDYPSGTLSSHYNKYDHYEPRPPYSSNHSRPYSAPVHRSNLTYTVPTPPKRNLYNRHTESEVSRRAPYAPRKFNAVVNTTAGFAKVENHGKGSPLPSYDPLNDVHLVDYFERRFGTLQLDNLRRRNMIRRLSRPGSSLSSNSAVLRNKRKASGEVLYKIAVTTGTKKNSGTDAKIYLRLKGTKDKLPKQRLTKKAGSVKTSKDVNFRFAKGTTHYFKIKGPEIGDVKSIIVENAGSRKEDAWFLQEIEIVNTKTKKTWNFIANQWLSLYHGDGQSTRELFAQRSGKTEYEIVTVTGDRPNGGTNANVFCTIFGKSGITKRFRLKSTEKGLFERGTTDSFRFPSNCVGPMKKIRIEHDNTGLGAGWYLERVVVTDLKNPHWKYFFPCGQWLATDEGDGSICRDLVGSKDPMAIRKATKYKVTVFTGNKKGAGTDANVSIILFGEFGDSGEKKLSSRKNNFERNKVDEFLLECPKLGRLERIRIGHDDTGFGPGWFLDKVHHLNNLLKGVVILMLIDSVNDSSLF